MRRSIAHYRTLQGALRYANDLMQVWGGTTIRSATPRQSPNEFGWGVIIVPETDAVFAREVWAAPRPKHFGRPT